jgi:hypothetical protein
MDCGGDDPKAPIGRLPKSSAGLREAKSETGHKFVAGLFFEHGKLYLLNLS